MQWSNMISESELNYCSSVQPIVKTHKDYEDDNEKIRVENREMLISDQFMEF